jgi:hypothetical protein
MEVEYAPASAHADARCTGFLHPHRVLTQAGCWCACERACDLHLKSDVESDFVVCSFPVGDDLCAPLGVNHVTLLFLLYTQAALEVSLGSPDL